MGESCLFNFFFLMSPGGMLIVGRVREKEMMERREG